MQRLFTMPAGGRIGRGDILASFMLIGFASIATLLLLQHQIAEFQWEQAARAAFDARMPAPIHIPPLFDFAGCQRSIIEGGLDIVAFVVDVLVVRQVRARICRVEARLSPRRTRATLMGRGELQTSRQAVGPWVDHPSDSLSMEEGRRAEGDSRRRAFDWHAVAYEGFGTGQSSTLRASAEACFRLAESGVGQGLAEELEALGKEFTREAEEADRDHATASV